MELSYIYTPKDYFWPLSVKWVDTEYMYLYNYFDKHSTGVTSASHQYEKVVPFGIKTTPSQPTV